MVVPGKLRIKGHLPGGWVESSASLEYIAGSDVYLQNMEDVLQVPATATLKAFECGGSNHFHIIFHCPA